MNSFAHVSHTKKEKGEEMNSTSSLSSENVLQVCDSTQEKQWEIIVQFHSKAVMAEWRIQSEKLQTGKANVDTDLKWAVWGADSNGAEMEAGEIEFGRKTMSMLCAPWLVWGGPSEETQQADRGVNFVGRREAMFGIWLCEHL